MNILMTYKLLICVSIFASTNLKSYSQNCDCEKLLSYGIYNTIRETSNSNNYSQEKMNSCNLLEQAIQSASSAGGGATFMGFGANGYFSTSKLNSLKETYCSNFDLTTITSGDVSKFSSVISADLLDSYNKCKALCVNNTIKFQINRNDDDYNNLQISIAYVGTVKSLAPQILSVIIDPDVFMIIDSSLYNAAKLQRQLDRNYSLQLVRKRVDGAISDSIVDSRGKRVLLSKATQISINLSTESLVIGIPSITRWENLNYIKSELLGEVLMTVLDSTEFFKLCNRDEWMLANGAPVPSSAVDFIRVFGTNVPDLRGVFLRGRNYSRKDEFSNPEGDFPTAASYRMDEIKSHHHDFFSTIIGIGNAPPGSNTALQNIPASSNPGFALPMNSTKDDPSGISETRPKNATISYFIRIRVRNK